LLENIAVDIAIPACSAETKRFDHATRSEYELGRTLAANADVNGARLRFEMAVSKGYRAARVDLADLLVSASAKIADADRAVALYEQAWRDGVSIGAFRLGLLYENGLQTGTVLQTPGVIVFNRDTTKAWMWYQRAADAGEPNALARLAERDERSALAETDPRKRDSQLFQAFTLYAAAVERASEEDWPGDAPKKWRYHRATLAHLLAEEGMMHQVADAYTAVLEQRPGPTLWEQLELKVRP
jgi:TPR repeat protein